MSINICWCIGEDQYEDVSTLSQLKYAESSAQKIADCMVDYLKFDRSNVYVMTNRHETSVTMKPTYANIKTFAERMIAEVNCGALSVDKLVVYVGMHGYLNQIRGNKRYLCLRSTRTDNLDGTALSYVQFLEWLLAFKAHDTIVIGDCCQELTTTMGNSRNSWVSPTEEEADETRKVLYGTLSIHAPKSAVRGQTRPNLIQMDACGVGELAYDGIYARYLAESIQQLVRQNSQVTIGQIARLTADKVSHTPYGKKCRPKYTLIDGCGDVVFQTDYVEPVQSEPTAEELQRPLSLKELLAQTKKALDECRYADARGYVDQAFKLDPENKRAKHYERRIEDGESEVKELQQRFLSLVESGWDAVLVAKENEQKWIEAFRFAEEALALAVQNKYALASKIEEARALYDEVEKPAKEVERKIRLVKIRKLLNDGVVLFKSGNLEEALKRADVVLGVEPENKAAQNLKAACLRKRERALAQKFDPVLSDAEFLLNAGRYAEASSKIEEVLSIDSANIRALELRSKIEAALTEPEDEVAYFPPIPPEAPQPPRIAEPDERTPSRQLPPELPQQSHTSEVGERLRHWLIPTFKSTTNAAPEVGEKPRSWFGLEPGEKRTLTIKGFPWTFIYCPPTGPNGFLMGSPKEEIGRYDDEILHRVVLTKPAFLMDATVTQDQYQAVMGKNPSFFLDGGNFPVEQVSWTDLQDLIKALNCHREDIGLSAGWQFSLPSEALWEYACRNFGEERCSFNAGSLDECGWYKANSNGRTHEVRGKRPNKFGFYDMHGNVWEWVYDGWSNPLTDAVDPCYVGKDAQRVMRGGGWDNSARNCRSSYRGYTDSSERRSNFGVRLALVRQ